jgi:hypothetical protein
MKMSIAYSQTFARKGFPETEIQQGFVNYVRALTSILDGHHLTEDEIMFPYFRDILADAPFGKLSHQHQQMLPSIDEATQILDQMDKGIVTAVLLDRLGEAWTKLEKIWLPHIEIEEAHITPTKTDTLLSIEEHGRLARQIGEHSAKNSGPDYLVTPFILYNLAPEDREYFSAGLPPIVSQELVPVTWKEKWQSMTPFLLV